MYDSANKKVANLSSFSSFNIENEKAKLESLKTKLSNEQANLANCPKGYVKNCIKPTESKIATLENQISALESSIKNANAYQAAIIERDNAAKELTTIQANPSAAANANDTVHPLFISQANVLAIEAKKMQSYFLAFSAVSFEALTAIVWLVVGLIGRGGKTYAGDYQSHDNHDAHRNAIKSNVSNDKPLPLNNPLPSDKNGVFQTVETAKEETNLSMGKL